MDPVRKALWLIETRLSADSSLEEIASAAGVSRFHLSRAFAATTGRSVMRYARGRRLTEAARTLAAGAPDILSVALSAGYGSHEAFTRAFRDQFGVTPEHVRAQRALDAVQLVEPIQMEQMQAAALEPPRFETGKVMLMAGVSERYHCESLQGIPLLWARFAPHIGHVPGQVGPVAYGVVSTMDDAGNVDYLAAVEVSGFDDLPAEFTRLRVPEQRYVVFTHKGHIAAIRTTFAAIWRDWMPNSGHTPADAPVIERYDDRFDVRTGQGAVEIWIPLKR